MEVAVEKDDMYVIVDAQKERRLKLVGKKNKKITIQMDTTKNQVQIPKRKQITNSENLH